MISRFRFVLHAEVALFERQGWAVVAHLGPVHGAYAVLMRWSCQGKPDGATEIAAEREGIPAAGAPT